MAEQDVVEESNPKQRRPRTRVRYARYSLTDSVTVAKAIHEQAGGVASPDRLAAFLNYSSTKNGAYLNRVAAARLFGLISDRGKDFVVAPLAQKILMPVYPDQVVEALVEAFFNVPLFKEIYETYSGKELPPEFGMKNMLRSQYGLAADQADVAYRVLMESAEDARFFATRGTRTHLIIPQIGAPVASPSTPLPGHGESGEAAQVPAAVGGRGGGGDRPITPTRTQGDLKSEYIAALIDMLREKAKAGDVDTELMERIEKLIGTE